MIAISTRNIGSLVAKAKRPLRLFALVCLSVSSATSAAFSAAAAPAPSISENQAMRIVAASPLRELNRAWSQCIDEALFIARINAMANIAKIEGLVNLSCEGYESRLTGELIKRQGYGRGNSIIAALKRKNRARYEALARAVTAKPKTFVTRVGGWTIHRLQPGKCVASISDQALINPKSSWLASENKHWRLGFMKQVSYSSKYEARTGQIETVQLAAFSGDKPIGSARLQLRFEVSTDFIGWSMPMDDAAANELGAADRVQFQALPDEQYVDRVFPIAGITAAWKNVRKCAGT